MFVVTYFAKDTIKKNKGHGLDIFNYSTLHKLKKKGLQNCYGGFDKRSIQVQHGNKNTKMQLCQNRRTY